jgi:signal transduction histidine kinase
LISCAWELVFDNEEKSEIVSCLQLETIFDESLPEIEVIDTKIIQVFVNLFDNACNALSKKRADGVTDFMPKITISCRNLEKKVEITIVDNGTGIDLTVNGNICEPFMTTKTPGTGTGLGLAIVKEIINRPLQQFLWGRLPACP